jgi:uncharacterized membrane protein
VDVADTPPADPGAVRAAHAVRHEGVIVARRLHGAQDRASDTITSFAGSMQFVYLHTVWFVLWIVVNAGLLGSAVIFDKFPFGLLTLIVSLEAIFLSTFVMISQNREAARADIRSELDFETNVRAEIWTRAIADKLGVDKTESEAKVRAAVLHAKKELAEARARA